MVFRSPVKIGLTDWDPIATVATVKPCLDMGYVRVFKGNRLG